MKLNIQLFAVDGNIVIGTEVDSSNVDKALAEIGEKISKLEEKANRPIEINGVKVTGAFDLTAEEEQELNNLRSIYSNLQAKKREQILASLEEQKIIQETSQATQEASSNVDKWVNGTMELANGQKLVKKEVEETNEEMKETAEETEKASFGLGKIIGKVAKWSLAVVGVRSAYSGIRRIMSLVEANSNNIQGQVKTMTTALANALLPVVQKIINFIAKLMMLINYIWKRLTGNDLFNFSKAFKDAKKSSSGIAKNTKQISKDLAGFDEMNTLSDNSSAGASGGAGGLGKFDNPFADWENYQPPAWINKIVDVLKWIVDNWRLVVMGIIAIGGAFLVWKLVQWALDLGSLGSALKGVSADFTGFLNSVGKGIEAIAVLGGLALVINSVTKLITALGKSGVKTSDAIKLLGSILAGVVVLITALTISAQFLQSPLAMAGLAVITASISAILIVISKTLPIILDALSKFIVSAGPTLILILNAIGQNLSLIINMIGKVLPPILNSIGSIFNNIFGGISKVISTVGNTITSVMNTAKNLITTVLNAILNFINQLGPAVNKLVDGMISAVTKLINFFIKGIEYMINTLIIGAIRGLVSGINKLIPGSSFDLKAPSKISIPRFKAKKGAIINMPGRGVPVGGAVGGEAGREGILPLTDSQQMEILGEAIGRYITINANITNTMNGRVISKELQKIQQENAFASNR